MFKKTSKLLPALSVGIALLLGGRTAQAQCGFLSAYGCPGTNYANYGVASGSAATLEYDNQVSHFHSSVVRDYTGTFRIWGEGTAVDGVTHLYAPTELNAVNFPGLTGRVLKAAVGGTGTPGQVIVLTTDGIFAWGTVGAVLNAAVAPSAAIQKIQPAGADLATGLPLGVAPGQVKMMFVSVQMIALTTCDGHVYVLSTNASPNLRGDGATGTNTWAQVQENGTNTPITSVVATRGANGRLMALKNDNTVWAWGPSVYPGGGGAAVPAPRAIQMSLPAEGTNRIKMIGANVAAQYVLYENGHLYALGFNNQRQLGDWGPTTGNRLNWVQPLYPNAAGTAAGDPMNDILWFSPTEHFTGNPAVNAINAAYQVYSWGSNSGLMIGRPIDGTNYDPGMPAGVTGADKILSVETGGHTTMLVKACIENYGYVGHRTFGSMGNGGTDESNILSYSFATANVQLCGATSVPQILVNGTATIDELARYCNGTSVVLSALPAGGTWSVVSGLATISGNRLSFVGPGTGTVTISYTAATTDCPGAATATKTFEIGDCKMSTISGSIFNDANGNASQDGAETGIDNDLWVNLVAPDGTVAGSVKVAADGTYAISVLTQNIAAGDYSLIITNGEKVTGSALASADAPNANYGYTGTNAGGVSNTGNRTGVINIGALGSVATVDFGISNDPAVLPVKFGFVAAEIFDKQLKVKWNTTSELNNSYFEIEASIDGTNFISIGKVDSKATNGISADALEYEFTKDTSAGVVAAGIALLAVGAGLFKTRRAGYAMAAMALGMVVLAAGCNKNRRDVLPEGKVYVRIAQVDKDGTKSYSKSVAVVKR